MTSTKMKYLKTIILFTVIFSMFLLASGCGADSPKESEVTEVKTEKETETEVPTEEWGIVAQEAEDYYVNATQVVNVLNAPIEEGAAVFGKVYNGEKVVVTGNVGHWSRIIYSGCVCYTDRNYLQKDPPNVSETVEETTTEEAVTEEAETKEAPAQEKESNAQTGDATETESTAQQAAVSTETQAQTTAAAKAVHTVCIDAGHQKSGISEKEPNGPGSSEMKAKLATGTQGTTTGTAEHVVNLQVSKLLEQELKNRGYQVVMIRETDDCPESNAERAQAANESGADIFIRVHANGSDDSNVNGIVTFAPSESNPYVANIAAQCNTLSQIVTDKMCETTGAKNLGVQQTDTMTGINWCQIPVTIVEMGFMSNPTEDTNLSNPDYQSKLAAGMANGIDAYFQS